MCSGFAAPEKKIVVPDECLALTLRIRVTVSTFGLWFMTWRSHVRQADETKRLRTIAADAANASRNAAAAARKSADALMSAERAYLFIDEDVEFDLAGDSAARRDASCTRESVWFAIGGTQDSPGAEPGPGRHQPSG